MRTRDTMSLVALAAVVAATWHVGRYAWRAHVLDRIIGASRELPWFSPLAYLFCFSLLALPLIVLGRWLPSLRSPRVQAAVLATAAAFSMLLNLTAIHSFALFVLAAGIGVQAGRLMAHDVVAGMRRARRITVVLAAILFAAGVPGIVVYRLGMDATLDALPAARAGAPNVILLILDTVRAANLSVYGYARPTTPTLERLGAEGVIFESAMTTAPWTAPSHATLLTGRYPFFTGISYEQQMTDSLYTLTEVLRSGGYATGAFMGNAVFAGRATGFERGFIRYDDFPVSIWQALWSATLPQLQASQLVIRAIRTGEWWRLRRDLRRAEIRLNKVNKGDQYSAAAIVENFLEWQANVGDRPFFAMINFFDAHAPYETPHQSRFNAGTKAIDRYDGAISYADAMIGRLAQQLQQRGVLDNTILVVTSDHGEQFGEHGLTTHGNSLYLELLHVPLLIRAPERVVAGRRIRQVVSVRDIPATILDLAEVTDPRIEGTSLARLWGDSAEASVSTALAEAFQPPNQPQPWPTSYGPMKSLVDDAFHYVRRGDGQEKVYRWEGDTIGRGDQTSTALGVQAVARSRATLQQHLGPDWTQRSPRAADTRLPFRR